MSEKPNIIKGYPNPSDADIKIFQRNNRLEVDGIIGRKTRAAIWKKRKHKARYTHLCDHLVARGGAKLESVYLRKYLRNNPKLVKDIGLEEEGLIKIIFFLSSEWKTGFSYLSTQDGVTVGARRLATSTLQRLLRNNFQFARHFDEDDWHKLIEERPDHISRKTDVRGKGWIPDANNGFPLDEINMRLGWLELSDDKDWWNAQILEMLEFIKEVLDKYPDFTNARLLTLLCRAANSGSGYIKGLSKRSERRAYRKLRRKYWKLGSTKQRRIRRIEELIPKDLTWKRYEEEPCCGESE